MVLTRDRGLGEQLQRLAAAAGAAPAVHVEPGAALRSWSAAPLALVGVDVADELAALAPARRPGVHLVGWAPTPDETFRTALRLGAVDVLELPRCERLIGDLLTDLEDAAPGLGLVVGVLGGSGGAGATTFAAALGQVAARAAATLVVDADPLGPGVDRVLGLEEGEGVRWQDLGGTDGRLSGRALRDAVPRRGRLGVLSWHWGAGAAGGPRVGTDLGPPPAPAGELVREVLAAARRGHGTVVVDLPRSIGPAAAEVLARLDRLVVLGRPGLPAAVATSRQCALASGELAAEVAPLLVVRGTPLDGARLARASGATLLLTMGEQRGLAESLDLGLGPLRHRRGALGRAAVEALALLRVRGPGRAAGAA